MSRANKLAEVMYDEQAVIGLAVTWEYLDDKWQRVWLNRATDLAQRAESDQVLSTKIDSVINHEGNWQQLALDLYDYSKSLIPVGSEVYDGR